MLNQSKVTIESGTIRPSILIDLGNTTSVSCMVANTGVTADSKGRKIVKAGTPLAGSLVARNNAFTVAGKDADTVGVILHDVDVTDGNANAQVVIFGFIDETKLDADVVALLDVVNTDETKVRDSLTMIKFVK